MYHLGHSRRVCVKPGTYKHAHAYKSLFSTIESLNQIVQQITIRLNCTRRALLLLLTGTRVRVELIANKHKVIPQPRP